MDITVSGQTLSFAGRQFRCATGKGGFSFSKREGDGATPVGAFPLRECWYRSDRLAPPATRLPLRIVTREDGWCDDPAHDLYNMPVSLPFSASHETLWRDDHAYDLIVPLGYNDEPPVAGLGSAIFLHLAQPDFGPTEGCVALALADLRFVLAGIDASSRIRIEAA